MTQLRKQFLIQVDLSRSTSLWDLIGRAKTISLIKYLTYQSSKIIEEVGGEINSFTGDGVIGSLKDMNPQKMHEVIEEISDLTHQSTLEIRNNTNLNWGNFDRNKKLIKVKIIVNCSETNETYEEYIEAGNSSQKTILGYPVSIMSKVDKKINAGDVALVGDAIPYFKIPEISTKGVVGNRKTPYVSFKSIFFKHEIVSSSDEPGMRPFGRI